MMLLSQAAQAIGGKLIGNDVIFSAVSTDSRSVNAGDLFVALQGPNFDGAKFIDVAAQSGAVAAMVNQGAEDKGQKSETGCASNIPLLVVDDTRLALGRLAAYWRKQFTIPVVAVTGSNGKTTVKEMLASILSSATGSSEAVLATAGNFNNDIGLPLTLLKLRSSHRYAVIEMGMNHTGEIKYLSQLTRPDVSVITNAGTAHLAGLGSVEAIARAKGEIFSGLSAHGIAVVNADDIYAPLWRALAGTREVIDFGLEKNVAVHAQWQATGYGAHILVSTPQGSFCAQMKVPGAHNVRNALAAAAAALALRVPFNAISSGLEKFSGVAGRMQRRVALHGAQLIDDSYNANPASVRAGLKVLVHSAGKKILVMGDMGELGDDAERMHGEVGEEARHLGVDRLLAIGELTRHTVKKFGTGAAHFERMEDMLAALEEILDANTTVLVKGSRFMHMERVVQYCADDKSRTARKITAGSHDCNLSGHAADDAASLHSAARPAGEKKCC